MATTNDSAVVDLGRLKTFKSKLDASITTSSANIATSPLASSSNYKKASADGYESCAMGNNAQAKKAATVALGAGAIASLEGNVAVGAGCVVPGDSSTAVGKGSSSNGNLGVAIGYETTSGSGAGNTCVGYRSSVAGDTQASTALGAQATVAAGASNSVALGAGSQSSESNEVSIGNPNHCRRIANVENPTNDTDAATKLYVDSFVTHVIEIASVASTLTPDQLKELSDNWPTVVLIALNTGTVYFPGSKVKNDRGFTFYAIDSTASNIVQVGNDREVNRVIQIDIESKYGNISYVENYLAFPAIATNPRFADDISVYAIGANSVAAGPGATVRGSNSTAIGNNANVPATNSVAVGSNSIATGASSVAIGSSASAKGGGSIAIGTGSSTNSADSQSVALGISSATTKSNQVSVGNNASGLTRYVSNVRDPVEDQDAATRYWVKNADRSDVFVQNSTMTIPGNGIGEFYLEANSDLNWIAVRGYACWNAFSDVWATMTNLPGESNDNWWIKTDLKVPDKMIPKANFIGYAGAIEFLGSKTVPYYSDKIAVGTDGYIYLTAWSTNHGSTPLGVLCLGHRFYL